MALFTLRNESLELAVSGQGGSIEGWWWLKGEGRVPLLRPGKQSGIAVESSCFPLVPFGNRVSGNGFDFDGRHYVLQPNVALDSHYLHGDGWLNAWRCTSSEATRLVLEFQQREGVYRYAARQVFQLTENALEVSLSVTNEGDATLPFGLGWHPYFPLTAQTRLQAHASGYWLEREQWLAGEFQNAVPKELDFTEPNGLPRRWINNGFSGWDGTAGICWPEAGCSVQMETDPPAPCYFLFVSDPAFDEGYDFNFFCLEPMSHAPDDHHRPAAGHLIPLATGETQRQTMRLTLLEESQ